MRRFLVDLAAFLALTIAIPVVTELALRLLDVRIEATVFDPSPAHGSTRCSRAYARARREPSHRPA